MSDKDKPSIDELRAQAMANMRAARESIGSDVLDRAVEMISKNKETQKMKQAKAQIKSHSLDDLTRELRYLIEDDKD